jgi:hypothetical protein
VIRAGVRVGSMIGVMKISNTKTDYLVLKKHGAHFGEKYFIGLGVPDQAVPPGRLFRQDAFPGTSCLA